MLKEEEIVKGCKKFEGSSQQALYNRYSQKMYGVCLRYISDRDEAKDILQDGFIKIFNSINQYKGEGSLEGWIRRVITNMALTRLREKKKWQFEPLKEDDPTDDTILNATMDADSSLSTINFTQEELLATINLLSDDFRIVFNLFCIDNYSHKEIAELLSINENTSRSRLNRARHILQKKLLKMVEERTEKEIQ